MIRLSHLLFLHGLHYISPQVETSYKASKQQLVLSFKITITDLHHDAIEDIIAQYGVQFFKPT